MPSDPYTSSPTVTYYRILGPSILNSFSLCPLTSTFQLLLPILTALLEWLRREGEQCCGSALTAVLLNLPHHWLQLNLLPEYSEGWRLPTGWHSLTGEHAVPLFLINACIFLAPTFGLSLETRWGFHSPHARHPKRAGHLTYTIWLLPSSWVPSLKSPVITVCYLVITPLFPLCFTPNESTVSTYAPNQIITMDTFWVLSQ